MPGLWGARVQTLSGAGGLRQAGFGKRGQAQSQRQRSDWSKHAVVQNPPRQDPSVHPRTGAHM